MNIPASALRFLLFALLVFCGSNIHAQQYTPVDDGSKVQFTILNHLVFTTTVNGYFKGLKGNIRFDPHDLKSAAIDATVAVKTISTGIGKRDRDLLEEKYFDAAKHPVMRMVSTTITASDKANTYQMKAELTIKGVTKTISFPFTAVVSGNGCQLNGQFTINRKDFKVGPDNAIDDKLTVVLKVLAKKQ
ncbi:YceI family protein [Chitinophaga sp. 22321]|uniref:YceI family protein n=1 Tax=Chitinophaga hostae TaxID=2831022 RepID=A0ABS5J9E3_9BACT|nr:YceI family protein [Chitinophaga hostae]MBS0031202.1 YceI family protein [Chitinophaga hostae]